MSTSFARLTLLLSIILSTQPSLKTLAVESSRSANSAGETQVVQLFDAMEQELVEVKFVPVDSSRANVLFKNKTNETLTVALPAKFGAVHVLGQFGAGGLGAGGLGAGGLGAGGLGAGGLGGIGLGGGGGGQGLGGGFGGGGLGGGGFGGAGLGGGGGFGGAGLGGAGFGGAGAGLGGGGFFRVAPDKTKKLSVRTVCLEHGKDDPNPRMKYTLVPLEQLTTAPEIQELCVQLGEGAIAQSVAQAAAWHLANGLSWDELAAKNRVESIYTGNTKYFSSEELQAAWLVSRHCLGTAVAYQPNAQTPQYDVKATAARGQISHFGCAMFPLQQSGSQAQK
jgi:hypothetical protein